MDDLSKFATAMASVGTMIVAIVAAVSYHRSARAAERQVKHAEKIERLRIARDLSLAAQRVIADSIGTVDTGAQLQLAYLSLFTMLNQTDSAEHKMRHGIAEKRKRSALEMQGEADALLGRRATWKNNTDDELVVHLSTMEGYSVQLERARLGLARSLEKYEELVRMHGERGQSKQLPSP